MLKFKYPESFYYNIGQIKDILHRQQVFPVYFENVSLKLHSKYNITIGKVWTLLSPPAMP